MWRVWLKVNGMVKSKYKIAYDAEGAALLAFNSFRPHLKRQTISVEYVGDFWMKPPA